jgi:type II secretory pathway component PulM
MSEPSLTLALRLQHLRTQWENRPKRDRIAILCVAGLVVLALLWLFLWLPMTAAVTQANTRLPAAQAQLDKAKAQWRQVAGLTRSGASNPSTDRKAAVTRLSERFALGKSLTGLDVKSSQISLTLTAVSFDTLVSWLSALATEETLFVTNLTLTPLSQPNQLRAEVTLSPPQ